MGIWHYIIYNFLVVFVITIDIQAALEPEERAFPPKPILLTENRPKRTRKITIAPKATVVSPEKVYSTADTPADVDLDRERRHTIKTLPTKNPILTEEHRGLLRLKSKNLIDPEEKDYRTTKVKQGFHSRQADRLWGTTINPAPMPIEDILESLNSSLTILTDLQEKNVAANIELSLNPQKKELEEIKKNIKNLTASINVQHSVVGDLVDAIPAWNKPRGFMNIENFESTITTLKNIAPAITNPHIKSLIEQKTYRLILDKDKFINFIETEPHQEVSITPKPQLTLPKIDLTSVGGMYLKKR